MSHIPMASKSPYDVTNIDEEICLLEDRLIHLRSTRNSLVPIGHLPAELLQRIFHISLGQGSLTIHLSWVSHMWRRIALEWKALWAVIDDSNLRWANLYLERSFPVPLVVRFQDNFCDGGSFSTVMDQLPRIKTLILPDQEMFDQIHPLIEHAFRCHSASLLPHLESFEITNGYVTPDMQTAFQNAHHLSLKLCFVDLTTHPRHFPHLRSLCLATPEDWISVHDFLDCLERMPALEALVLLNIFSWVSDKDRSTPRRSSENRRSLVALRLIEGELESNIIFLQKAGCITRHTSVSLQMHQPDPVDTDELAAIVGAFDEWTTSIGHSGVTCLALDSYSQHSIYLEYGHPGSSLTSSERGYANLRIKFDSNFANRILVIPTIPKSISFEDLRLLWLRVHDTPDEMWQALIDAFGHLPQLRHLALSAGIDQDVVSHLMTAMSAEERSQDPLFSALTALVLPECSPSEEVLRKFLLMRKEEGLRLETLGLASIQDSEMLHDLVGSSIDGVVGEIVDMQRLESLAIQECYAFIDRVTDSWDSDVPVDIF